MPSRHTTTAAAALLLALAPLAVPGVAIAAEPTADLAASPTDDVAGPDDGSTSESADGGGTGARTADAQTNSEAQAAPGPQDPTGAATSAAAPAPVPVPVPAPVPRTPDTTPIPAATTTDEVTPNETSINVYVVGAEDVTGQPGQAFATSIFNLKNSSSITIPSRTLDVHWSIDGPGTFNGRPFSVANSGTANVTGCTFTTPKQTDCVGANPQSMSTGGANFNHIRVPVRVDADALPGDVVTVNGYFEPNASTDYVNANPQTSSTWTITIPLTPAVVDQPAGAVGATPTVTGVGVPGGTVDVTVGDQPMVTVDVQDDGTWSLPVTTALPTGPAAVTAVQHRNGSTAAPASAMLEIDATAPAPPIVDDPGTLADPTGPITGTAEPGSTVVVRDSGGSELGRAEADDDGDFSVRLEAPLPEGSTALEVVAADQVGNESEASPVTAVVPDTTAPNAPVVGGQDLATPTGPVVGTAEPGSTVIVRDADGTELGRGEANADGDFRVGLDDPLAEGDHDVQVVAQDHDGNESDPTAATITAPDVTAPEPPISTTPESLTDGTGPFTGSAEAGATVVVRDPEGNELGRGAAGQDGRFTIVLDEPLTDGAHDLEFVAADEVGNLSDPTPIAVEVDETAPEPPVVTSPTDLVDGTGPITGTAEPGAVVIVRDEDGTELGRDTADATGDFSIVLDEALADGSHPLEVVARDAVGNVSTPTPVDVTVDTEAPAAPVLEAFDDIVDGTGIVRGTAEPGTTVVVRDQAGRELGRGTTDADGRFAFRTTVPLEPGAHLLSVVAVDRAGNVSPGSSMLVTLVPEHHGEDEHAGVALPGAALPAVVAPVAVPRDGTDDEVGSRTSGQRPARGADTPTEGTTDELAFTGAELGGWLATALAALGLGALLRVLGRRRDRSGVQH